MRIRFSLLAVALIAGLAPLPLAGQAVDVIGAPEAPVAPPGPDGPLWPGAVQAVLWDNGPFVNGAASACSGSTATSRLQDSSLGMNTYGFGHAVSADIRIADDFTVPDGPDWLLSQITFFAYQTGSGTASTLTAVNAQIWDGSPDDPASSVVCGDTATNCMTSTAFTGVYRVLESSPAGCTRPVMAQTCDFSACVLPAGTYWVDWQTDGSLASGPWAPPITINGQTATGNGLQSVAGVWAPALDNANPAWTQGFPFLVEGDLEVIPVQAIPAITPVGIALLAGGLAAAGYFGLRRRR